MGKIKVMAALAVVMVTAGLAGASVPTASAGLPHCYFKNGSGSTSYVLAFAGHGATRSWCRAFNSTFNGHRVAGYDGGIRCFFYSYRLRIGLGVVTRSKGFGHLACVMFTPASKQYGFHRIS